MAKFDLLLHMIVRVSSGFSQAIEANELAINSDFDDLSI